MYGVFPEIAGGHRVPLALLNPPLLQRNLPEEWLYDQP